MQEPYPSGAKFATNMVAVCLTFFLIGLDSTILAILTPALTRSFGTIGDVGWYLSVYRLGSGSFQLLFGKLYSFFPSKALVLSSLIIFLAGSLLSALAPTSSVFILGRAITGFATAGVTSGVFAIIIQLAPLRSRSKYAGIGAATEVIASLSAPVIGGALIDRLSWRWCFFIELPLIGTIFAITALFFKPARREHTAGLSIAESLRQLDLGGAALFVLAFALLILALQWGGTKYEWPDWRVQVPMGTFLALILVFAWLQHHQGERAILPPRILLRRNVLFGFLFSLCNNGALSVVEYYMPIFFQTVKGLPAIESAVMVLPSGVGLILSVPLAGFLTSYFGYYNRFMILNSLLASVSTGLLTTMDVETAAGRLVLYQGLLGFGAGIGFQGPQVAVQAILTDDDAQIGIAIIQLAQALGPAVFVATTQTIFSSGLASLSHSASAALGQDLDRLSGQASYENTLARVFYLPVALACVTLPGALGMEWRSVTIKDSA